MYDIRRITFIVLSSALLFGTVYSVVHHTYLDTSDPLVILGYIKHPLHDYSYFARKTNVLNTIFIKRAWGWTTAAFLALWITHPQTMNDRPGFRGMHPNERLLKWLAATAVWLVFTAWFFGPSIFDRVITLSGGECAVRLPSGEAHIVPVEHCFEHVVISLATHPEAFSLLELSDREPLSDWKARPRLTRGHDVSGHVFLLAMALLFLADMVEASLRIPHQERRGLHNWALIATGMLMCIWIFAIFTTGVYYHTPSEKLSGYLLGIAGYLFTQLSFFRQRLIG